MRIAKIIGKVTCNRMLDSFRGATLRVAVPVTLKELKKNTIPASEELVLWDEYGAGYGDYVALSEGGEAAQPFLPERKPVDAYNAALLDDIEL